MPDFHPAALQLHLRTRRVLRLPGRPMPATRGGKLMFLSAMAALARRVRRLRRNRFTA